MKVPGSEAPDASDTPRAGAPTSPVFYGWFIVAAGTLGLAMTIPGQTPGVSVFLDHIIDELGLTRSGVSTLYLIGTLLGSLVLPFVGRLLDRRGPRLAVILVASAFALACVWMGAVQGVVTLLIGFTLIRALGQGSLSLVSLHVIAIWFVRRRGVAIGIAGLGMAMATALFPTLIEFAIDRVGWRSSYMLLGGLVALTILPIGALVFRDRPERYGLSPDGTPNDGGGGGARVEEERSYTPREARRTLTYWLYLVGLFLGSTLGTGLMFHHYSILAEDGIGRGDAALAFVFYGAASATGNLVTGGLITRVPPRFLLSGMLLALGAVLVLAGSLAGSHMVAPYGLLLGLQTGIFSSLQGNVFALYFGRRHHGSIKGIVSTVLVIGSAIGPLIFALGFDLLGSYTVTGLVAALPPVALAVAAPFLPLRRGGRVR
jgi:MFS transporter, OFA family, oxalate/formate antiporter